MKTCRGLAVEMHLLFTLALIGGGQLDTPACLPPRKGLLAPTDYRAAGLDNAERRKMLSLPVFRPLVHSDHSQLLSWPQVYPTVSVISVTEM
jgi:hypothetical protein